MKIIDFERKGNVVRFYLGKDDLKDWDGDDWNDAPYEHNAGEVYSEYVSDAVDLMFPFDWKVFEPCDGEVNSLYCKDDMKARKVPCIIAVPPEIGKDSYWYNFKYWIGAKDIIKFYFGDNLDKLAFDIPIYHEAKWIPWAMDGNWNLGTKCSRCKHHEKNKGVLPRYCSKCGSKMTNGGIENWMRQEHS